MSVALRVFIPFALGYYFSYLVRNVNAVIAPDLVADLGLTAASLGLLTSAYFLAFAAFQLPLGVLLDRYGPRRVESVLLLTAAAGSALFALSETLTGLVVARALIGLGVSACLMGAFKANTLWFGKDRLPLANGCVMTAGGLGALSATAPVEALLGITDWRGAFLMFAALAAFAAVALFTVVPRRAEEQRGASTEALGTQIKGMGTVLASRAFWQVMPISTINQAAFLAIQGLWAGPWLADVAGLGRDAVARHLLIIAACMTAGFLTLGALTARLARYGVRPFHMGAVALSLFALSQLGLTLEAPLPPLLMWSLFGYFGTSGILLYAHLSQEFPSAMSGRVVTSLNLFAFGGAFLAQWATGGILDLFPAQSAGSFRPEGYRVAFGSLLALQVLSLAWMLWRRPRR